MEDQTPRPGTNDPPQYITVNTTSSVVRSSVAFLSRQSDGVLVRGVNALLLVSNSGVHGAEPPKLMLDFHLHRFEF